MTTVLNSVLNYDMTCTTMANDLSLEAAAHTVKRKGVALDSADFLLVLLGPRSRYPLSMMLHPLGLDRGYLRFQTLRRTETVKLAEWEVHAGMTDEAVDALVAADERRAQKGRPDANVFDIGAGVLRNPSVPIVKTFQRAGMKQHDIEEYLQVCGI